MTRPRPRILVPRVAETATRRQGRGHGGPVSKLLSAALGRRGTIIGGYHPGNSQTLNDVATTQERAVTVCEITPASCESGHGGRRPSRCCWSPALREEIVNYDAQGESQLIKVAKQTIAQLAPPQ